jgi:excisionase family DNA binding protein
MTEEQFGRLEQVLRRLEKVDAVSQAYFSIKQAAAYTGLSEDHVRRRIVKGILPSSNVGSKDRPLYRVARADIDRWMESRKMGPA